MTTLPIDHDSGVKLGEALKDKYSWENERLAIALFARHVRALGLPLAQIVELWGKEGMERRNDWRERAMGTRRLIALLDAEQAASGWWPT